MPEACKLLDLQFGGFLRDRLLAGLAVSNPGRPVLTIKPVRQINLGGVERLPPLAGVRGWLCFIFLFIFLFICRDFA